MINKKDVIEVKLGNDVIQWCREHPVQGPSIQKVGTGQLKAVGEQVMREVLGLSPDMFNMQLEAAREMGVSYLHEDGDRRVLGLSVTVSTIKDDDVLSKRLIVPRGQLRLHAHMHDHNVIAVFLRAAVGEDGTLGPVHGAYVAGWIQATKLLRWEDKTGSAPFNVKHSAVAPCDVLLPMSRLLSRVRWSSACV